MSLASIWRGFDLADPLDHTFRREKMTFIRRLPVSVVLIALLLGGSAFIDDEGPQGFCQAYQHMGKVVFTPFLTGVSESISFGPLCMASLAMGRMKNHKFSEYCMPLHLSLRKHLRTGWLASFPVIRGTQLCDGSAAFC
jgi:hypothetical protein